MYFDERYWNVIAGYVRSDDISATSALASLTNRSNSRTYKTLVLDRKSLELIKLEPYREQPYE